MFRASASESISISNDDFFQIFLIVVVFSIKYSSVMNLKIECIVFISCVACNSSWFQSENSFDCSFSVSFQFFNEKFEIFNLIEWFSSFSAFSVRVFDFSDLVECWLILNLSQFSWRRLTRFEMLREFFSMQRFLKLISKLFLIFSSDFRIVIWYCISACHIQLTTRHWW